LEKEREKKKVLVLPTFWLLVNFRPTLASFPDDWGIDERGQFLTVI